VILPLAASGPVIPSFGGGAQAHACEVANHLFCSDWVSQNWGTVLWPALRQHVVLTVISVAFGFVISTVAALLAYRRRWVERPVLVVTSILYTIPSLALFELLTPVPGFGLSRTTALVALISYTLLIMFRNTLTGLREVPGEVREAAQGMGMKPLQSLLRVEIPLALPAIIAGVRIATVTVISLATVAVVVDNEGLGVPILSAINDAVFKTELIIAGAMAVALALAADGLLVVAQRLVTPWARSRAA